MGANDLPDDEPFRLTPQTSSAGRKKLQIVLDDKVRQGVLFDGANCLPGQQDLFDGTSGKEVSTKHEKS